MRFRSPSDSTAPRFGLLLGSLLLLAAAATAETYIWVDELGTTHLSDDPAGVPGTALEAAGKNVDELRSLWADGLEGPVPATPLGGSGRPQDRVLRLLLGAVEDLSRGETARASATLRSVLRLEPGRPEAHWYLALLDRRRGRYQSAEEHLWSFLSAAGLDLAPWRHSAERRLADLVRERRLADVELERGPLHLEALDTEDFRVRMDAELGDARSEYAATVIGYLSQARDRLSDELGVTPREPLGVVFYGKAAYMRAHRHRFSFQTVGFFDGSIHISSPAHPSGGLRALLFHEYTHAVFREQTGGDRPYWLNEGLAEHMERLSDRRPASTRSERASLRTRLEAGQWIPLRQLVDGFSGLSDEDARAAYLQAILAAEWISARTDRSGRARLLEQLGRGVSVDQSLHTLMGVDTDGLDAAVQETLLSEFPSF